MMCLDGDNEMLYKEPINLRLTQLKENCQIFEPNWFKYNRQFWMHAKRFHIYFTQQLVWNASSTICLDGDNVPLYKERINLSMTLN